MSTPRANTPAEQVARLPEQDRATLIEHWRTCYGGTPPKGMSRKLLVRAIAYKLQEQSFGHLSPSAERQLKRLTKELATEHRPRAKPSGVQRSLRPGMRLVRSWHGETHSVQVVDQGFEWRGRRYRSLSRIAREITGTHRNGPDFFGLRAAAQSEMTLKRTPRDG